MEIRLSELADTSGASSATIKFYLRAGLLPRGTPSSATRATYDERHVRRLASIRALTDLGGWSLRQVGHVVAAIDRGEPPASALRESASPDPVWVHAEEAAAMSEVGRLLGELGWEDDPSEPSRLVLARCLVALRASGRTVDATVFRPYARAAAWLVTEELEDDDAAMSTEAAVVAAVVADAALIALRRLARDEMRSQAGRGRR